MTKDQLFEKWIADAEMALFQAQVAWELAAAQVEALRKLRKPTVPFADEREDM